MEQNIIHCPFCNSENVHIESVKVNRGGQITEIKHTGTHVGASLPDGRGASITVTMWCESGHKWTRKEQFCKGTTTSINSILIAGDPSWQDFTHDLWRD